MKEEECVAKLLKDDKIDYILMTHLDCHHASGFSDFSNIRIYVCKEEYDL